MAHLRGATARHALKVVSLALGLVVATSPAGGEVGTTSGEPANADPAYEVAWEAAGMRGPYDVEPFDHPDLGRGVVVAGSDGGVAAVTGEGVRWRYRPSRTVASVAVGDVTGDGAPDVVVGMFVHDVVVLSGATGEVLAEAWVPSVPDGLAVGDATGDGRGDVYVATRGGDPRASEQRNTVHLLRGTDLATLWSVVLDRNERFVRAAAGDLTGDGRVDVVAATRENDPRVRAWSADGEPLWETDVGAGINAVAVADGGDTVYATMGGALLAAVDGTTGAVRWTSPAPGGSGFSRLAIADLTGDGQDEAVWTVYGASGYGATQQVLAHDRGGALLWARTTLAPAKALAVGDLTGDGRPDVAVSTEQPFGQPETGTNLNHVAAFAGATGEPLWVHALIGAETNFLSGLAVVDVTGDEANEVVVASRFDTLLGLSSGAGEQVWRQPLGAPVNAAVSADLDGSGPAVVTGDDGFVVTARDAATSEPRWQRDMGAQVEALATVPTASRADVIAVTLTGVHRLAGGDGAVLWSRSLPGQGVGAVAVDGGAGVVVAARTSPNPRNGVTYNHTGILVLLDAASGADRWLLPVQAPVRLALGEGDDPDLLVAARGVLQGTITAYDGGLLATAPVPRWTVPTTGSGADVRLAAGGGQVLAVEPGARVVRALDAGTGAERWAVTAAPPSLRSLGFADVDGDGLPDAFVALDTFSPRVQAVAGADGSVLLDVHTGVNWLIAAAWHEPESGAPELVLAHGEPFTHAGRVAVLDGAAALSGATVDVWSHGGINAAGLVRVPGEQARWAAYGWPTQHSVVALFARQPR